MSNSSPSVKRQLSRVLAEYRSIIEMYAELLEYQPLLAIRISFRMEAAKFYIDQLDFWIQMGNMQRFEAAANRARKNLEDLYQLISELVGEYDRDEE
jgi:hypothetical protein